MRRVVSVLSFALAIIMLFSACSFYVPSSAVFPLDQRGALNTNSPQPTAEPDTPPPSEAAATPTGLPEPLTLAPTGTPLVNPTPVFTFIPTQEPTARPTAIPTAEPTPTPAPTPAPTPQPTPQPTPTPTPKPTPVPVTPAPVTSAPATVEPTSQPSGGKYFYLSFDDGPCKNTRRVIEILERYDVKATFFTVGYFVDRNPDIAREIVASGNLIACHSYTHAFEKCYASAAAMMAEVGQWENAVMNAVGYLPWRLCFRFPGGSHTASAKPIRDQIISLLHQRGYEYFDWNAGNNDKWPAGNTQNLPPLQYMIESYRSTVRYLENNGNRHIVFLCHDTVDETVEMLPLMLEELLAKGYEFRLLSQHPKWHS